MSTIGNVSILVQTSGGASTLGVIPASGDGVFFPSVLYRYANLTLPYSPNDPGLTFTYDNSTLVPVVLLYARFFNLLNEASVPIVANVGTSAFGPVTVSGALDCLDVRSFGAVGDGITDDTAAIQAALNQAYQNYLGNAIVASTTAPAQNAQSVQTAVGNIGNGSGSTLTVSLPIITVSGNTIILTLSQMNYGSGPSHPAMPTVVDSQGNVYTKAASSQDGEFLVYVYSAPVTNPGQTTIEITMTGLQFNSFLSAVAAEFSGLYSPLTVDGTVAGPQTVSPAPHVFPSISLSATNYGDLVIYSVGNLGAQGAQPIPPSNFTVVNAVECPQPNGLNGALPYTVMAYQNWNGTSAISSQWTAPNGTFYGGAVMVAFRRIPLTPAPVGKTTVCIPEGVSCMVSPIALDEQNLPTGTCRYGPAAYSLVISDGVTLRIDGSLIANPAATEYTLQAGGSGSPDTSGDFGWFLVVNSAWLLNSTLMTPMSTSTGGLLGNLTDAISNDSAVAASPAHPSTSTCFTSVGIVPTVEDFVMYYSIGTQGTGNVMPSLPAGFTADLSLNTPGASYPTGSALECGVGGWGLVPAGTPISKVASYSITTGIGQGSSVAAVASVVGFKALSGSSPVVDFIIDNYNVAGGAFLPMWVGSPWTSSSVTTSRVYLPGEVFVAIICSSIPQHTGVPGDIPTSFSITDNYGNKYYQVSSQIASNITLGENVSIASLAMYVGVNRKRIPLHSGLSFTVSPLNGITTNPGTGLVFVELYAISDLSPCGSQVTWTNYLAGTAFNEGPRNKNIRITGTGQVVLHGDIQSGVTSVGGGQLFPTGLARFVCADNSSIDSLEIITPFGCAVQWLDSNIATIQDLYIHDAATAQALVGVQDPGIIEMDLLRTSTVNGNTVLRCPANRGILDWAGYQNMISNNTLDGDYTGFEYRDCAGETAYYFSGVVTANESVTDNTSVNNTTVAAAFGVSGVVVGPGSYGFLFYAGYFPQTPLSTVTGLNVVGNMASNNSTDLGWTAGTGFSNLTNNTLTSPSTTPGALGVIDSLNTVTSETPSGLINGSNAIFTLEHIPVVTSLVVLVNGLQQYLVDGDYTVNGKQLTLAVVPNTGSTVVVSYQYVTGN